MRQEILSLLVDYEVDIETLMKAGDYGDIHPKITADNFLQACEGQATLEAHLVKSDSAMTEEEILKKLEELGLQPATELHEFIAFCNQYPESNTPIIPLGCISEETDSSGNRYHPLLNSRRELTIYSGDSYRENCYFLAFPIDSTPFIV